MTQLVLETGLEIGKANGLSGGAEIQDGGRYLFPSLSVGLALGT